MWTPIDCGGYRLPLSWSTPHQYNSTIIHLYIGGVLFSLELKTFQATNYFLRNNFQPNKPCRKRVENETIYRMRNC